MITQLIRRLTASRFRQIEAYRNNPWTAQLRVFERLLEAGGHTFFGEKYRFDTIGGIGEFQQRVPIHEYDELVPYINRMLKGEQNILWNTPVRWFAKSSGTTAGKSKFIPVSRQVLHRCHYQGPKDVICVYLHNYPKSKLLDGKTLTLGGSHQPDEQAAGVRYGDLSAVLIQNSPRYAEFKRVPKRKTALIADFETKVEGIAAEACKQNVSSFAGVPSWNLVLMKRILEISGKKNLLELWPKMELFMHGGISFTPYREQYRELIPSDDMRYMDIYNASEGFFAFQDEPSDPSMLLLPENDAFYEFIPLGKLQETREGRYTPDTMETAKKGINYAIVISTSGGLWRYLIGDTVMFTSLYPHKIKITGRTRHFINVFGEELIIDNAENALRKACEATGTQITDYTVAPIFMDSTAKGAHEWVIEFAVAPNDIEEFANLLDAALCAENSDYEAKRSKNTTLRRLVLHAAPAGAFYRWMESRNKLGGQNKVPRLSNTREHIEELLHYC
ncbi:MAG: GH3 auxin-responsive promoter family protein [Bacteroidales bacterium]|nr:GH3 auxin-responsive promoter family protein [Bacteroidales bacterium]MCL2133383.1 GH3 auxin-responsive promoter family protein [Bacteroidales bacterium]